MIQIKRNNKVFFTLEDFGEGSKLSYQLMDHHYIILKFSTATPVYFEIGDSVEIPDFGYFELTSAYFPKHNESDGYDYEMQMDAYYMAWKNKICKYRPQHGANETSFNLTTTVGVHMNVILNNLKALGLTYNGKAFSVDYTTYNNKAFDVQKRFLIEYGSISILDALNAICSEDALNCEWWIDGSIIYLGYCEMEGQTTFEQGVNVLSMSYSESKSTYITRLYAFGSDRNIPKGYFTGADADVTTDGVATDYLMLPNKEVDSDGFYAKDGYLENVNVVKNDKQAIEGVVMFEDEYPKVESAVSSIKTYDSTVDNEDGTKTTQTFWQVTSTDSFTNSFKESWKKKNLTLGIKFTSGALMGMEFDVNFKVIDKVNYFEIVANDTYGRTLPDGVICPNVGNKFFLYNWDATKITDTDLIPAAQLSLFDRAKQYYQKTMISNSNFTCTMDGDKFYNGGTYDYHPLGEQVKLIHEMFPQMDSDGNHYRNSRIIGMDIKLDIPYDKPEYVVGEKAATSRLGKLEEKVDSITVNGLKIDGSAGVGGSVYVIGVNDITPETDSNVYSARRTKKNLADIDKKFLRKDQKDVAQQLITFLKGINTAGIENYGNNITKGLTELYDVIKSHGFNNSMTAGSGWRIDANGNVQVESIEVRSYMRVLELVMNRLSAEESDFIFTESGTVEKATLNEEDGTYTLVMRKKTDKDITAFQVDDVLKGVVNDLAEPGAVGVKYYTSWVQVKEVNQTANSIKVAVYADKDTPAKKNFNPCDLMVLHRWGNTTKKERQSCWYISSIEKRIVMLDGVTKPKLEESNYASFYGLPFDMENFKGYTLDKNQPYLYVRGAFLQDVCFIDYLGKVVKQERYRGVWSQEVANSDDPYIVKQTTFDTVYHKNAKWQCNSTEGTKEEPSVGTTDWTKLSEGGKGSDGKSAAKAYVTSNDIAIPTDANGVVTENFQIGNTFSLMVDGKNCTDLKVTMDGTPATNAFKAQLNQLWLTISSSKGAELGLLAYTLHFTVRGVLDNVTYSDVVTILVRPNRAGRNLTKVSNFYKWGASGTEAPSGEYTKDAIPERVEGLDYLWNYEVCYNDAGETISTSEKTCIGNFARGIETITEFYQIGTADKPLNPITVNSDNTLNTSGWQTSMPPLTAKKRYLWNQEVIKFTDGTYSISEVHLAGAQGESVKVIDYLVNYAISSDGKNPPKEFPHSQTPEPTTESEPYLWTRTAVFYSDGSKTYSYSVARQGQKGDPGKAGRNLTNVVNYYKWGNSGTQTPSGDYTENNIPEHVEGLDYLWNYEVCYSDNDVLSQSGETCIGYFPKNGEPGKEGKGIKSITEYYQIGTERKPAAISISTDGTTVTIPSGWEKTMDGTTTPDKRYVWNQEVIEYSNGTYSVTAVHLAGAQGERGVKGDPGDNGEDGADGALPNLFGYDTKVECLVGHHNVVHTKTGFAVVLDSLSDDDTSSDRYCLLRIKNFTDGEGTYSVSGYITHSAGGKFEFDCGDVTPQTMTLTANKRTRFAKKFELPKNSYKHIDFEFFRSGLINIEELKIERTDNTVSECTPFVTLAHDSITQKQNILLDTNFTKTNDRTIWNVFSGDIVENAYNGLSAFHYKDTRSTSNVSAVEILSQKFTGKLKPSTWYTLSMFTKVKGKVISYIGSNVTRNWNQTGKNKGSDAVLCDEYIASMSDRTNTHQLEESTEYKRHSITFLTAPDLTNADERMYFYIWAQTEIYVTMLKLEECEKPTAWQLNESDRKGEVGKPLVGPTEWNASAYYMSGKADNEPYQSIVINPKNQKQMYLCGYSHSGKEPLAETSTSSVDTCTEEKPWVQVPYQDFVATKVLFAAKSLIKDLNAETIEMRDSNGNRLFYLHDGQLECNVGTFKNITAIGGTFKDIEVTGNSTFKGALNGVTGSFRELNCVGPNGKVAGGIKFDNSRMYFDGDLYSQGYNDAKKRGNRFYASDVWCRGNFGHRGKAMAVVYGDYMMAYPNGLEDSDRDRSAVRVNLTQKTTVSGKTFYEIPLYSPDSNGESNDAAGMPIDVVVFNITNTSKEWLYKFTRLSSGKEWRVFNANNNYGSLYIADTGTWRKLPGGANASYMYVPPKFLTPAMSSDIIGAGVFVSYISDIDW